MEYHVNPNRFRTYNYIHYIILPYQVHTIHTNIYIYIVTIPYTAILAPISYLSLDIFYSARDAADVEAPGGHVRGH